MSNLPLSVIFLSLIVVSIFLGLAQRTLARMRLKNSTAILLLSLQIIAHFLPTITFTTNLSLHLGALIPLGVVIYLLATTSKSERLRALGITLVITILLWLTDVLLPIEPGIIPFDLDPLYIAGLLAGLICYFLNRSRRSAFISAVLAIVLNDLIALLTISFKTYHSKIIIGGGGVFDALLINGVLAVIIAEFIGEIRERFHRGPAKVQDEGDK